MRDAIDVALAYDEWVVVEEAIVGREIEVGVLGNLEPRASVPGEIVPGAEFYDYADKYLDDGAQVLIPAPLTAEQVAEVQRAGARGRSRVLRCEGMARVDFFFEEDGRGLPAQRDQHHARLHPDLDVPEAVDRQRADVPRADRRAGRLALERHGRQRRNTATDGGRRAGRAA